MLQSTVRFFRRLLIGDVMLYLALRHYWKGFKYDLSLFTSTPKERPASISGGNYWQYRIAVERFLFSMVFAFFAINALSPRYIETASTAWLCAALTAIAGLAESNRLKRKLKGQLEFEEIFYG